MDKMKKYTTLVISGGGIKGLAALGLLQAVYDSKHSEFHTFIGTSIGAIISYLLCIGFTPTEMLVSLSQSDLLNNLSAFNIANITTGSGVAKWSYIHEFLEKLTIEKIGYLPTLHKLYLIFKKKLICCTFNNTKKQAEKLDYITYPDLPCLTALRMSSNLPLIFDKFKYMNNFYLDGGLLNNLPIHLINKDNTLAINLTEKTLKTSTSFHLLYYIYEILCISIRENNKLKRANVPNNCHIIDLEIDKNLFQFNLSQHEQLNLFSYGYQTYKLDLTNRMIRDIVSDIIDQVVF